MSNPMAETQSAPSLRELSERASPGEWHHCQPFMTVPAERTVHGRVPAARVDYISTWPGSGTPPGHRVVVPMEGRESTMSSHDMAFVARLVSDFRAGRLIDPTTLSEAVASARAEGWQPIETAPKDETEVLLWCGPREMQLGVWQASPSVEGGGWWMTTAECSTIYPTHWQPLPAPPTTPGGQIDG